VGGGLQPRWKSGSNPEVVFEGEVMTYIELKRKQSALRRELRAVDQEVCGAEDGHSLRPYCEWGHSGKECSKCGKRFKELCHYVGCKCPHPHST
jgi:hypothetical protein